MSMLSRHVRARFLVFEWAAVVVASLLVVMAAVLMVPLSASSKGSNIPLPLFCSEAQGHVAAIMLMTPWLPFKFFLKAMKMLQTLRSHLYNIRRQKPERDHEEGIKHRNVHKCGCRYRNLWWFMRLPSWLFEALFSCDRHRGWRWQEYSSAHRCCKHSGRSCQSMNRTLCSWGEKKSLMPTVSCMTAAVSFHDG